MENNQTNFTVRLEGQPDKSLQYAAYIFSSSGTFISRIGIQEDSFSLPITSNQLQNTRIFIAPVNKEKMQQAPELKDIESIGFEASISNQNERSVELTTVPEYYWRNWFICFCRVRGKVLNWCNNQYHPVYKARVHICEVDPIIYWLQKLPEQDLFTIREDLLKGLRIPDFHIHPPLPDPPPDTRFSVAATVHPSMNVSMVNTQMFAVTENEDRQYQLLSATIENTNKALLFSDSPHLVRQYFIDHYKVLYPWFCYFWRYWYWYRCDEIKVIETDINGIFDSTISYFCRGDHPDLYFWVEYNIEGVWTSVYRPSIICHTYWDYACGSEVTLYLNDGRIPCISNPTVPGRVVIVNTIGRDVNVNQIPQHTGAGGGLTPSGAPFGGSVEPNVIFGEGLLTGANPVKYYRWSYKKHTEPDSGYKPLLADVGRHYLHIETIGGETVYSYPVYHLGPQPFTPGLFEIQTPRQPNTNEPWAVVDGRYDTASAFFNTAALENNNPALAAGFYDLKLELFHADGSPVNFTSEGIDLRVPSATIPAPFADQTVTTVDPSDDYKIRNSGGQVTAFHLLLRIDNNPTFGFIYETRCEGNSAGPCGFLQYNNKTASVAEIGFHAEHPNDFATYSFRITRGSGGTVFSSSGNTPSVPNDITQSVPVASLLGDCNKAAFSENLYVAAMATDGWSRLSYLDSSDTKAFALTD